MAQTNMISQAIIRQMKRVKTLPPTLNGCYYLFREMNSQSKIVPISSIKLNRILKKISETIPLNTLMVLFINYLHVNLELQLLRIWLSYIIFNQL